MTTSLNFPPELQDLVIDHMHGQKRTLGTCGLVNKSCLLSSRHHLFGSVTVRIHNWKDFVQLLESPLATFAQSVNAVTISLVEDMGFFNELVSLLRGLPALGCLRLEYGYWPADTIMPILPGLLELDLHKVLFDSPLHMAALFSHFPRLQKASLCPIFRERSAVPISHFPEAPRTLECLRLHLSDSPPPFDQVALWLCAQETPPSIRVLELGFLDARSLPSVGNLLRALGPDLNDLDLRLMYHVNFDDIKAHIDLSRNTNLRNLTIHLSLRRFQRPSSFHAPWALLGLPHSPISTLTLVLSIETLDLIDNLDWAFLNTALGYPHFDALGRLCFIVHCFSSVIDTNMMEEAIRARVQTHVGIVEVSLVHTSRVFTHGTWQAS
ncbi:hypothetical protein DFH08DRAFT_897092 [Mycena albidolilacea]|uniref:Uncharacterized protein n=1 Tax=Mycena albidolilacea TaxID=1033008 RepID=A0AAD6Z9E6_9AGAR|nr:hypothetical protein DFH08DRAFT_897092 [Mycena albidolilacea]